MRVPPICALASEGALRPQKLCGVALVLLSASAAGCILTNDKCDAHQVEVPGDYAICVCEENAAPNSSGAGCTPCGENEVVKDRVCTCQAGFVRASGTGICTASAIGASCSSAPCSAEFPFCYGEGTPAAYCTRRDCASNADCPESWSCENSAGTRYCRKAPSGLGVSCTSSPDCAAYEASYCEAFQSHTCFIQGCAVGTATCPNEWLCCDYALLVNSPLSTCIPPAQAAGGVCPQGGQRVTP